MTWMILALRLRLIVRFMTGTVRLGRSWRVGRMGRTLMLVGCLLVGRWSVLLVVLLSGIGVGVLVGVMRHVMLAFVLVRLLA